MSIRPFRKPRNIVPHLQGEIDSAVLMLISDAGLTFPAEWRIYVTDTGRGRTRFADRTVTVPLWAYEEGTEYFIYYTAHELAHVFADTPHHSPEFYRVFRRICPANYQHFEFRYKPRLASAAGISKPK